MTPRQRSFAEPYVLDHNGAAAAIVGFTATREAVGERLNRVDTR